MAVLSDAVSWMFYRLADGMADKIPSKEVTTAHECDASYLWTMRSHLLVRDIEGTRISEVEVAAVLRATKACLTYAIPLEQIEQAEAFANSLEVKFQVYALL